MPANSIRASGSSSPTWRGPPTGSWFSPTGMATQYIKEGKNAIKWTRLSCLTMKGNTVPLPLCELAYNLAIFPRALAFPSNWRASH